MSKTIGIIGGGQLALMIVQAASKYGIKCICLDPNPNSPAFMYSESILGDYNDDILLKKLSKSCDIVIYEFENIDLKALESIEFEKLFAGIEILRVSKNRNIEKNFAKENGYNIVRNMQLNGKEDLCRAISEIGYPAIIKTAELGYDGKGQKIINCEDDLSAIKEILSVECIYEQKLDFDLEMSVICIRAKNNQIETFTPFINQHVNGILHKTSISKDENLNNKAIDLIENLMIKNNFYGILCVEMFVKDQQIYFNEMAPRPHNSGHVTMNANNISQFEQLVRALMGYKLSNTEMIRDMQMINILGQDIGKANKLLYEDKNIHVYLYGKKEAIINRKMGHINVDVEYADKIDKEFENE